MKKLYNILTILAILNISNVIASEGQSDIETNPSLRKYKATNEGNAVDDEEGGNNGLYYDNKALRDIHDEYDTKKDCDDKTSIEKTNKLITVNRYKQLQITGNAWMDINTYLSKLDLLKMSCEEVKDTPNIIQRIIRNYLSKDAIKDILDVIQELYESSETPDNDKSKLFEIFNNIKEMRDSINTYIMNCSFAEYDKEAINEYKQEMSDKITNGINDIKDILSKLERQNANKLKDMPYTLHNVLDNIISDLGKLLNKYCILTELIYKNVNNEEVANNLERIVNHIDTIIQSVGYYFQKV